MKKIGKKLLSVLVGGAMLVSSAPVPAGAAPAAGTPYNAQGEYDVSVPHVLVNQVFGASDNAEYSSHSFIELYNPTSSAVSLEGWNLYYKSSEDGPDAAAWQSFALTGSIAAQGYYLVRCAAVEPVDAKAWMIPAGDAQWNVPLHNKGLSVLLTSEAVTLGADFAGAVTDENRPEGYVDLLAVQGNDSEPEQAPPVYEGEYADIQSKKKAVRRTDFADTDNNKNDGGELNYEDVSAADKPVQNSKGETISAQETEVPEEPETPAYTVKNDGFEADAAFGIEKKGGVTLGDANKDGGVAEIVSYNADNGRAYVVNGQSGKLDVFEVKADGSFGTKTELDIKALMQAEDPSFSYGDMTSVAVDTQNDRIAVALQDSVYSNPGRVAVLNYDNEITAVYTVGVQPDMVTFAESGRYILTADEGEPRNGYGAGEIDPAGSVSVIDTQKTENAVTVAGFAGFDSAELAAKGVIINKVNGEVLTAAADLEPEYIAVNGGKAYVALQEANAVAVLDIAAARFENIFPLGFKDYSLDKNAIDLNDEDGTYAPKTYENTFGVYMPDGISVYAAGGKTYILTANEGDAREWGDFTDEEKRSGIAAKDGTPLPNSVRVLNNELKAGIPATGNYLYGGRSFSIFEVSANGLNLVFDSASNFEAKTWQYLPAYYNASNDDIELESRTAKKGIEPEAVAVIELGGRAYAFIALERIGGIMVYDVTDPSAAQYVNYVNTRDFNGELTGDVAPEGLAFAVNGDKTYLLAAFEVSGTVASFELTAPASENPGTGEENPGENPGTGEENPGTGEENPGTGEENPGTGNEDSGNEGGGCSGTVFAGGAAVSAAALLGAVVLFKKRRTE